MVPSQRVISLCWLQFFLFINLASAAEQRGPILDWNLRRPSEPVGSGGEILTAAREFSFTNRDPLQFSADQPHALCLSGKQNPLQVELDKKQLAALPTKNFSLQLWVRPEKQQTEFGLVSLKQDDRPAWLLGGNADHFYFTLASDNKPQPTQLVARSFYQHAHWYQITATYDGQQQKIYVDGKLAGEAFEQRGSLLSFDSPVMQIGALPSKSDDPSHSTDFAGQIAAIRVWNRTLTESEIKSQFTSEHSMFPGALATYDSSRDWPTFGHDNHRSRRAGSEPGLPLHLAWHRKIRPGPRPAWPPPAQQDFWNRKQNLKPRVAFDRCFEPVASNGKVYLGSSSADQLYCFDFAPIVVVR